LEKRRRHAAGASTLVRAQIRAGRQVTDRCGIDRASTPSPQSSRSDRRVGGGLMSQTMRRTPASTLPSDHPGIDVLYGLLAFGQLPSFYRLAEDAAFAPDLSGKVAMARLAAADVEHFDLLCAALRDRGADPEEAIAPFAAILEGYHASTAPAGWL